MRTPDDVADTLDLAELARAARRSWTFIVAATLFGAAVAGGLLLFGPRRFEAASSIVVRSQQASGASLLAKLAGGPDGAAGLLQAGASSPLETEVQILSSRELVGRVVDSLRLQVEVRAPDGFASNALVRSASLQGSFKPRKYSVSFDPNGVIRVEGGDTSVTVARGQPVMLPVGQLLLAPPARGPSRYDIRLFDREDAVTRLRKRISVSKAGGEVLRVSCRTSDSLTAAAVPNLLVGYYLILRHSTDRGTNQHRVEFLTAQLDSVTRQLASSEQALKRFQESSRLIDPQTIGKLSLERAGELRASIGENDVERGALEQLLTQVSAGSMSVRDLAAYPAFLKSPAINALLTQIGELETERSKLLVTRLDTDSEVVALSKSIRTLEGQLGPMAAAYESSLKRQHQDLSLQLDSLRTALGAFPAELASGNRLQRSVLQLSQVQTAMQAQLVEAKVAAVTEGGNVQSLDVAEPPMRLAFPRPVPTMAAGVGGGLFVGLMIATLVGMMGRWMQDPATVERATGVPALRFDPHLPLLLGASTTRTILVAPLSDGQCAYVDPVIARLVQTASLRSISATVLDLSGAPVSDVRGTIERLENENGLVVVKLPTITSDTTAAAIGENRAVLLVAAERRVARAQLVDAVQMLKRLDVPLAGVVIHGNGRNGVVS
ncbi:MAG TPA: Wzz/FepE/Etk N-terminal domain-containing protein [Gemmatimonadaceae bacterium]